jgi:hypothetical protein
LLIGHPIDEAVLVALIANSLPAVQGVDFLEVLFLKRWELVSCRSASKIGRNERCTHVMILFLPFLVCAPWDNNYVSRKVPR